MEPATDDAAPRQTDRLGSPHDRVYIRCFFPDRLLDQILRLEERLHRKITHAARTIGVEAEILPGSEVSDHVFTETRDEIERLRLEDPSLFEVGGERGHAYSGEEYRQELRQGLQDPETARRVRGLAWGSGSGLARPGADPGFVFCARVGNHGEPVFRYVSLAEPEAPEILGDTLTALSHAHADVETIRVLTDEAHRQAYQAWAAARQDIYERWKHASDPANLQPRVPKAMREAASILREHPPSGHTQEAVDRLIDAVEAPYGNRIQKVIREAMRSSNDPREKATALAASIEEQGLQPVDPPKPLPPISIEDVHLVCWQAIVPAETRE